MTSCSHPQNEKEIPPTHTLKVTKQRAQSHDVFACAAHCHRLLCVEAARPISHGQSRVACLPAGAPEPGKLMEEWLPRNCCKVCNASGAIIVTSSSSLTLASQYERSVIATVTMVETVQTDGRHSRVRLPSYLRMRFECPRWPKFQDRGSWN